MALPLRKIAYDRFKARLFDGTLAPGAFVTQKELCEALDSPMGAVREALKRLEAEGLANLFPQRGVQIADIDVRFINEAFQFRVLVEQDAARKMARNPKKNILDPLLQRTTELRDRVLKASAQDIELLNEGLRVDLDLHVALVANFDNSLIADTYSNIEDRVRLIRRNSMYSPERLAVAMKEHIEIISLLLSGDEEASVDSLNSHLKTSWQRSLGQSGVGVL